MNEQQEIEVSIEALEHQAKLQKALHNLLTNEDFKVLILDTYLKEEPVRLTKLLGDTSIRANEKIFNATLDELKAIGLLDSFLRTVDMLGKEAQYNLEAYSKMQENEE